jgi:hypothetical protein
MKDYTYGNEEIQLIQKLIYTPPNKIWWDFVQYIFDYNNYYIKLECISKRADTQNKSDEAIIANITIVNEEFKPSENTVLVCQNQIIDNAYIVKTFLYFTTYRKYSVFEKITKRTAYKIKNFFTGNNPIESILSETIGGCEEIICHPKSDEVKNINPKYANILDVGLLLEIEGKCLKAFIQNNTFGFHIWDEKYFFKPEDLKEDAELYEFIKIKNLQ